MADKDTYGVHSIMDNMDQEARRANPTSPKLVHPDVRAAVERDIGGTHDYLNKARLDKSIPAEQLSAYTGTGFDAKDRIVRQYTQDLTQHHDTHANTNMLGNDHPHLAQQFTGQTPVGTSVHAPAVVVPPAHVIVPPAPIIPPVAAPAVPVVPVVPVEPPSMLIGHVEAGNHAKWLDTQREQVKFHNRFGTEIPHATIDDAHAHVKSTLDAHFTANPNARIDPAKVSGLVHEHAQVLHGMGNGTVPDPGRAYLQDRLQGNRGSLIEHLAERKDVLTRASGGDAAKLTEITTRDQARATALAATPEKLDHLHQLEARVAKHADTPFHQLSPVEQKARADYVTLNEHAHPELQTHV